MLFMLAVAAFVGWGVLLYERTQRFQPSSFYEYAPYWREDISAALNEIGENGSLRLPFAVTYANGPSAHRTESYSFPLTTTSRDAVFQAIRSRVRGRLTGAGCKVGGESGGGSGGSQVTVMSYRLASRAGAVHICAFKSDDNRGIVVITMHEEGRWRGGFGTGVTTGN